MRKIAAAIAFSTCMVVGGYLILHDHATIGGWICILALLGTWGFEHD